MQLCWISCIYVPQKIGRGQEGLVDDRVRLFAFPHSQGSKTPHRLSLPTKMEYRLYWDGNVFQLFQKTRGNSWVYIVKGASDDSSYRRAETDKRHLILGSTSIAEPALRLISSAQDFRDILVESTEVGPGSCEIRNLKSRLTGD